MKRSASVCVILFVAAGWVAGQAADPPEAGPVHVALATQLTASVFAAHVSVNPSVAYRFGLLGAGAGVKAYRGLGHDGFYVGPYGRIELGWFYLGAGPFFLLRQPSGDDWVQVDGGTSFIGLAGIQVPLARLGPGQLALDTGIDFSVTPSKLIESESDSFVGALIGSIVATIVGAAANSLKANVGLAYSLRL